MVAEQPGSHRFATPKNNSVPRECCPVEPRCSTEALKDAIQANWGVGDREKQQRPPDVIILIFSITSNPTHHTPISFPYKRHNTHWRGSIISITGIV
ncbi:hypothetical protein NQZ68_027919 [Dissostichus eleginoides]|nr:hypothetical protein NQZ68_027919 [Dissostichus eleginoides]